ncbi:MAG: sugar phosphate isomerase/epimerase [Fibrobacteria bacterium]|nr:sugar phosphate isomerase/epimerase [Fibrobacteria bacterium]
MLTLSTNIHDARLDGSLAKLPGDLSCAVELGLGAVEVGVHGLDVIRCGRLDLRRTREFRNLLDDHGLRLSVHAPDTLDLQARRELDLHRSVLHACLEFCALTRGEVLVVHPGRWVAETDFGVLPPALPGEQERLERLEEEVRLLREAADAFPEVRIALENARPYLPYSPYCAVEFPDRLLDLVLRVDRVNVGICLDTGHLHMTSRLHGYVESDAARLLAEHVIHLHVHDNFGRTGNWTEKTQTHQVPFGRGDMHMPPGLGDIDFEAVLGPVLRDGFDGMAVCELRGRYLGDLPDHIGAFRRLMEAVQLRQTARR